MKTMNPYPCQFLDDYLAHDLAGEEQTRFTAHLADCPQCSRAVADQERLEGLLVEATARMEPVPPGLVRQIESRLRSTSRRRLAGAVAALLSTAAIIWLLVHRPTPPAEPEVTQKVAGFTPVAPEAPRSAASVRVTFPTGNVLAIKEKAESENVTLIRVYPGLRPAPQTASHPDSSVRTLERNDL